MRVDLSATSIEVYPGTPVELTVSVFNTDTVIRGYRIEVLGIDPEWLDRDFEQLNLFPDDTGIVTVTLLLPEDFPAGERRLVVAVEDVLDPSSFRVNDVELLIHELPEVRLSLEPDRVNGRTEATFNMVFENTGNGWLRLAPTVAEDEGKARIRVLPDVVDVAPGETATAQAFVRRRRPILGNPATRVISFSATGVPTPPLRVGSFIQRPWIGRGLLSLLGLLVALTAFGAVLIRSLGLLVDRADAGTELVSQTLEEEQGQAAIAAAQANPTGIGGRVADSAGVPYDAVTVQLYTGDDTVTPVASTATNDAGTYSFDQLLEGSYVVQASGAQLSPTWYPGAATPEEAEPIELVLGEPQDAIDFIVDSPPAQLSGVVLADDPSGARVQLIRLAETAFGGQPSLARSAIVREVLTEADGGFLLEDIPVDFGADERAAIYELVVTKEGFAEESRLISLKQGEIVDGVELRLRIGDGIITGRVTLDGVAPGTTPVEVIATADGIDYRSVTFGDGEFVFRSLPTPALYAVRATREGFRDDTRTVTLSGGGAADGTGDRAGGLTLDLRSASADLTGQVNGTGGAAVTVRTADLTVVTRADESGSFTVSALPVGVSATVTAEAPGFRTLTQSCTVGSTCTLDLAPSASDVTGVVCVRDVVGAVTTTTPVGGIDVRVESPTYSARSVTVDVATSPIPGVTGDGACQPGASGQGTFLVPDVPDGTYTVTFSQPNRLPFTRVIRLPGEGQLVQTIISTSSIAVNVRDATGGLLAGADVELYRAAAFAQDDPGNPEATITTDGVTAATFTQVDAPEDYVIVVVFQRPGDPEPTVASRSFPLLLGESKTLDIPLDVGTAPGTTAVTSTTSTTTSTTTTSPTSIP